ncbi:MAG TPA: hypothetical protein ENO38_01715 [Nitrososphaeria archaeon]|nr:hypothetical protein [Conexivisphaerales archaeon]PMP96940.1 MAG: hypothetical protein C0167_01890 [Nitrososphaera sp.]HEU16374.1 hypothetical protein [Nitrososphaeria archaeon]
MGSKAWVGDDEGRMYLIERRDTSLVIYGPVPSMAAHLPELSLLIYAAVAFGSIALGFPYVAIAAMLAAIAGVPLLAVAIRRRYIRGEGQRANLRSSEPIGRRVLKLTVDLEGSGRMVLYANTKDVADWELPQGTATADSAAPEPEIDGPRKAARCAMIAGSYSQSSAGLGRGSSPVTFKERDLDRGTAPE